MPWDFNGHGFDGWIRYGEKPTAGWHMVGVWSDDSIKRIPDDGSNLQDWETLPEVDEGDL